MKVLFLCFCLAVAEQGGAIVLSGGAYIRPHGSDFTLHHVEQYTVSVPLDGGLPFAIVDDGDGSGCVCVERITVVSGAC